MLTRKGNKINLKRISRPGLQIYSNYQQIPKILGGKGIVILSTSRGIITGREARLEKNWRRNFLLYMVILLGYPKFLSNLLFVKSRGKVNYRTPPLLVNT